MSERESGARIRVFCAVELPEEARARAAEHIERLRRSVSSQTKVRWERTEKLHITIKFLGEIEPGPKDALLLATARAASGVPPFDSALEGAGAFPPRGLPRVLWLGVTDLSGHLALLQQRLEDECAKENFPRESRTFHPHITIARLQRTSPADASTLLKIHKDLGFEATPFPVTEIVVMRSELGPGGSRYTTLSRHQLGTGSE